MHPPALPVADPMEYDTCYDYEYECNKYEITEQVRMLHKTSQFNQSTSGSIGTSRNTLLWSTKRSKCTPVRKLIVMSTRKSVSDTLLYTIHPAELSSLWKAVRMKIDHISSTSVATHEAWESVCI